MSQHSIIGNISPELMDEMYRQYLNNPDSVDASWKQFFLGFDFARARFGDETDVVPEKVNKEFLPKWGPDHQELLEIIRAKETTKAKTVIHEHVERGAKRVSKHFKESPSDKVTKKKR